MSAENPFAFTYDAIGNPTGMLGIQLSWNGRQLQQVTERDHTYSYKYNGTQGDGSVVLTKT